MINISAIDLVVSVFGISANVERNSLVSYF